MRFILTASALALIAACSTTEPSGITDEVIVVPDAFDLAMNTVSQLEAAGNEQMAIDRLTQLLGDPNLSEDELAMTLMKRAELRYGEGNDAKGAVADLNELIATYPESEHVVEASTLRETARIEVAALETALSEGGITPTEEFEYRFRLGEHQEAADLMLARNLSPDNDYIVDLFQMGYLCDDPTLTGPGYSLAEPDGTLRTVRFCEFGK